MENNFIQIAASAGHALTYTIGPIIKHIIDSPMASRILSFKASVVSGLSASVKQLFTNCRRGLVGSMLAY